jgi:exodeoxyribonuclease VII large subunit
VRVQGAEAPDELVRAIDYFNKFFPVDVIIFGRGGGSLEDLQAFNSERVARALFSSRIPVVSGIGHEHNTSIADLVADVRAATPTMAAALAIPDRDHVERHILLLKQQMFQYIGERLIRQRQNIRQIIHRLHFSVLSRLKQIDLLLQRFRSIQLNYQQKITFFDQQLKTLIQKLSVLMGQKIIQEQLQVEERMKLLQALNPTAVLERGYSITYSATTMKPITHLVDLPSDGRIRTQVSDGEFDSATDPAGIQPKLL